MMNELTTKDLKHYMMFHAAMALCWAIVTLTAIVHRDAITWVFGVTVVVYLALDELMNVYCFWREYHGRISKVQEEDKKAPTGKE